MSRILTFQISILGICLWAAIELLVNFPYPSPLIKPLLPPKVRWPEKQVEMWTESASFPSDFLEYFGRDPQRQIPPGDNIVAPADGIVNILTNEEGKTFFIVNMSFWDVHVIRAPVSGIVTNIEEEGMHVERTARPEAIFLRGKDAPVQKIITIRTKQGDFSVRMITSYWASRLKVWAYLGQQVEKGERIGRILLGSTTVIELPLSGSIFIVTPGAHVKGGQSLISDYNPNR